MAQNLQERAHLTFDRDAYAEGWERVFGKRDCPPVCPQSVRTGSENSASSSENDHEVEGSIPTTSTKISRG